MKKFSEKHDSWYDDEKDIWLEPNCDDSTCMFCWNRPDKPSEVENHDEENSKR